MYLCQLNCSYSYYTLIGRCDSIRIVLSQCKQDFSVIMPENFCGFYKFNEKFPYKIISTHNTCYWLNHKTSYNIIKPNGQQENFQDNKICCFHGFHCYLENLFLQMQYKNPMIAQSSSNFNLHQLSLGGNLEKFQPQKFPAIRSSITKIFVLEAFSLVLLQLFCMEGSK